MSMPKTYAELKSDEEEMHRHIGQFGMSRKLICNNPGLVADALSDINFLPLRVEVRMDLNQLVYIGISPRFDSCPAGKIPWYDILIESNDNGFVKTMVVPHEHE